MPFAAPNTITQQAPPSLKELSSSSEQGTTFVLSDHNGVEIERLHYDSKGTLSYRQIRFWTVTAEGDRLVRQWTMNADGTLRGRLEGCKDAQGRIKSQVYYSADGSILDKQEYQYDDTLGKLTFKRWNTDGVMIEEWESYKE